MPDQEERTNNDAQADAVTLADKLVRVALQAEPEPFGSYVVSEAFWLAHQRLVGSVHARIYLTDRIVVSR